MTVDQPHQQTATRLWGGRFEGGPAEAMFALSVSTHFDWRLARHDLAGSRAHARALRRAGLLTDAELDALIRWIQSDTRLRTDHELLDEAVRELGESRPVWAGLSTSGIIGFKFPEGVDRAIVYPDGDGAKQKTRRRHDGSTYIGDIPGLKAAQTLVAEYPDRVSIADHAIVVTTSNFAAIADASAHQPCGYAAFSTLAPA